MGAYPCYAMADVHLCQVLVTWQMCSAVCQWSHYLFIPVPLPSFILPVEVSWHGFCISWAEQVFSSLVQTLWNQARVDRRYFVPLQHWCVIILFCGSYWGQNTRTFMLSVFRQSSHWLLQVSLASLVSDLIYQVVFFCLYWVISGYHKTSSSKFYVNI